MKLYIPGILLILCNTLFAQSPAVENVRFEQRTDGSLLVDIYYDVTSGGGLLVDITIEASDDNGETWDLPCSSLTGDVGEGISPGTNKHVVWDFYADNPDTSGYGYQVRVTANQIICGQIITEDFTLTEDLDCTSGWGYAIAIDAPNVTLDLGGHTILGNINNGPRECVNINNVEGTTIRNGTIEGFVRGIIVSRSDNATIENITIRNLDTDDPDTFITGIILEQSQGVVIQDSHFEYLPVAHKGAVNMGNSNAVINNIEQHGGGTGVDLSGDEGSSGSVINSRFIEVTIGGVLIQHTNGSVQISNNIFTENGAAIKTDAKYYGGVSGVTIENNEIREGNIGIHFNATIESHIYNNIINNNIDMGIMLEPNMGCGEPGNECFYSTANIITDNVAIENGIDLYHDDNCLGNTWERNTCETNYGTEIPECTAGIFSTAREGLNSIDSAAAEFAADAQLVQVTSLFCDTTGKSLEWTYIYRSITQQISHEFWYRGGKVLDKGSLSYSWFENDWPIPELWIDSDSAMVVADSQGGREFKDQFKIQNIEINLSRPFEEGFAWRVNYFSQDSTFATEFDATME